MSADRVERVVGDLDPGVVASIYEAAGPARGPRLAERLNRAANALDADRFDDARRLVIPLLKEIPSVAAVQEIAGLAAYGQHRWRDAAGHLELAQRIVPDVALLPVLADVYRAQERWNDVAQLWAAVRAANAPVDVLAEGRIVAASALADQGRLESAIRMMSAAAQQPQRIQNFHLRQWYVLGDFHDRAGDHLSATGWFRLVFAQDPEFADTADRLRQLGR